MTPHLARAGAAALLAGVLAGPVQAAAGTGPSGDTGHQAAHHGDVTTSYVAPVPHRYRGNSGLRMGLHCDSVDHSLP